MAHDYSINELRNPPTLDEANAAIDYAETRLEEIGDRIEAGPPASVSDPAKWIADQEAMQRRWAAKLSELEYLRERLRSDANPVSALYEAACAKIVEMERELAAAKRAPARASHSPSESQSKRAERAERNAENLRAAVANRDERIAHLTQLLQQAQNSAAPSDETKKSLRKSVHDTFAFGLEAIEEVVTHNGELTPLARLFIRNAETGMPRGHREAWRAHDYGFAARAAEAMFGKKGEAA